MRIIFLGTPVFAVPTLERLLVQPGMQVVGLLTQPDRPAGRGHHVHIPPTKVLAASHGIPVLQPERLSRSPETVQAMRDLHPDVLVMVAFGQILKQDVLDLAPLKVVNLHGSILPKYRGAAPINWAIIKGETTTGVSTMLSDAGVDTGPMLLSRAVPLGPDMDAEELAGVLAQVGADLMIETLEGLASGTIPGTPQDDAGACSAPRLTKEMGHIDWSLPASAIHNLVRGLVPWPGTSTIVHGVTTKIWRTRVADQSPGGAPGTVLSTTDRVLVACGAGAIELLVVQPQSRNRMSACDWARGLRVKAGTVLGSS